MKPFVLDCSVSAAWCLKDEHRAKADRYLELLAQSEAIVPSLWVHEMANVLVVAERKRRITAEDVRQAMDLIVQLPINVETTAPEEMSRIAELATRLQLTAYDAAYLDVAIRHRIPLATMDAELRRAAVLAKVRLL